MQGKSTSELLKELENFSSFGEYANANKDHMINRSLSEHLNELIVERNISKAEVIRRSELNENYAYQIISGIKPYPGRDKLICLAIGIGLSVNETNSLLKLAGLLPLYPRVKRDSIVIIGINAGQSVMRINEILFENAEETLN